MPSADLAALIIFCVLWLGYGPFARWIGRGPNSMGLHAVRVLWLRSLLHRENRIFDSALIGLAMHSASFFASTSLIAIGALLGVLTGLDRLRAALEGLTLTAPVSSQVLEVKVLLPLAVLVHGLFRLTWSLRQMNYTVALMGAAPPLPPTAERRDAVAEAIAGVLTGSIRAFDDGIRSYYFAIVGLSWLTGPWSLIVGSVLLVSIMLYRQLGSGVSRQFKVARALVAAEHEAGNTLPHDLP